MPTAKDIINGGLGKIGASRVNSITPPVSVIESLAAAGYPKWKRSELRKRRWVFATVKAKIFPTTTVADFGDNLSYTYNVPGDMLRPIRDNQTEWVQRGQTLYSRRSDFIILEYIADKPDNALTDPQFIDLLESRIAMELAEPATQNPGKRRDAVVMYKDALTEAARLNAFILDPQPNDNDDTDFDWVMARAMPEYDANWR